MKNSANTTRYTKWTVTPITFTKMELDGQFIDYSTRSGHVLTSKYQHDAKLGKEYNVQINYDTHYGKWRLVELKG